MDTPGQSAPGGEPAATEVENAQATTEAGVKPPVAVAEASSPLDGIDSATLLAAMEEADGESGRTDEAATATAAPAAASAVEPEVGGEAAAAAEPEAAEPTNGGEVVEPTVEESTRTEAARPPQRLSVRSLPADQQFQLAEALDMVRRGDAADIATALAMVTGGGEGDGNGDGGSETPPPINVARESGTPFAEGGNPSTPATPDAIKGQIKTLREQRRAAIEDFDRGKEAELTEQIEDLQADLWRAEQAAQVEAVENRSYTERYHAAVDAMEERYPEAQDETSDFSVVLDGLVAAARERQDPMLKDPGFIGKLADKAAGILGKKAGGKAAEAPVPATAAKTAAPPPAPRQAARPVGSALAPGSQTAARPSREQMSRMIQEMPLEELEKLVCTE